MSEPIYNFIKGKGWVVGTPPVWSAKTKTRDGVEVLVTLYDKEPEDYTLSGYKSTQAHWLRYINDYNIETLEARSREVVEVWVKITRI